MSCLESRFGSGISGILTTETSGTATRSHLTTLNNNVLSEQHMNAKYLFRSAIGTL